MNKINMLNIACGDRFHKDWINIDFQPKRSSIKRVNILSGLPFESNSIEVAYSSHFLEHLSKVEGAFLIKEIYRVLKTDGIIRLVVPDLENICKEYLNVLELVVKNNEIEGKYEWITIELLDQMVRKSSGGEMGKFFDKVRKRGDEPLAEYIQLRIGENLLYDSSSGKKRNINFTKILNKMLSVYINTIRLLIPKKLRQTIFNNTSIGEKHLWMYDRYSLSQLLSNNGFQNISIKDYMSSQISNFNEYLLDIKSDGTPYKGIESIYIEAIK